jgi:hypothetical protein
MIGHPLKVRELIEEIDRGEVLLPEIQRAYVWKGPQVAKLHLGEIFSLVSCSRFNRFARANRAARAQHPKMG